jgi:YD repeat-containing protein
MSFGNTLNTQYRYYGMEFASATFYGRLRGICVSDLEACGDGDASTNVRMNLAYAYDRVKNITTIADRVRQERMSYTYDELDRLSEWKQETPYGSATYTTQESYAYDQIGNIKSKTGIGSYTYLDGKPHAVTHINGLRVANYDQNGNMTTRTESATYVQTFDVENRLTAVNGVRFGYDADGGMVKMGEGSTTEHS